MSINGGFLDSFDALIGVVGTLLGTFMGWLLTQISNKGKITLFLNSFAEKYSKFDSGIKVDCQNFEAGIYYCKVVLDIYNSSSEPKIMRDIRLLYKEGKKRTFIKKPKVTYYISDSDIIRSGEMLSVINVPAKSAISILLETYIGIGDKGFEEVIKEHAIVLEYRTESKEKSFYLKSNKSNEND